MSTPEEPAVPITDWYPELLIPGPETTDSEREEALKVVRMAMKGIEEAISAGKIKGVQISFEIVPGEQGFTYSSDE